MGETSQVLRWDAIPRTRKAPYEVRQLVRLPSLMSVRLWSWTVCRMAAVIVIMQGRVFASSGVLHGW